MTMLRTLLEPFGHLAFDDARIDPVAPRLGAFAGKFPKQRFAPLLKGLRRPRVAFRQAALQNMEAPRKRKPIGIETFFLRGLEHQRADYKMSQRQSIHLLNHSGRSFAAEMRGLGGAAWIQVRFLFVINQFGFPTLMVAADQLCR